MEYDHQYYIYYEACVFTDLQGSLANRGPDSQKENMFT